MIDRVKQLIGTSEELLEPRTGERQLISIEWPKYIKILLEVIIKVNNYSTPNFEITRILTPSVLPLNMEKSWLSCSTISRSRLDSWTCQPGVDHSSSTSCFWFCSWSWSSFGCDPTLTPGPTHPVFKLVSLLFSQLGPELETKQASAQMMYTHHQEQNRLIIPWTFFAILGT